MNKSKNKSTWKETAEEKCQRKCILQKSEQDFCHREYSTKRKMLEVWKKQFALKKFGIEHDFPLTFISSQWQSQPGLCLLYFMYRVLVMTFFIASLITSIIDPKHIDEAASSRAKWLIYLTNWGFTLCTLQSMFVVYMIIAYYLFKRKTETKNLTDCKALGLYKIYWIVNVVATDTAFGITIIYWSLIYNAAKMEFDALNFIMHVMNSVLMGIDLLLVAHPIRILHFYWPLLNGVSYIIFSIIYYLSGGTSKEGTDFIYPILNWSKPGMTIMVCVVIIIFIIVLHCAVYGIYLLRKFIVIKLKSRNGKTKQQSQSEEVHNNPVFDV